MSKPNPSITANLLHNLSAKKIDSARETHTEQVKQSPINRVKPKNNKLSSRSAEKSMVQSRTRTSPRGK